MGALDLNIFLLQLSMLLATASFSGQIAQKLGQASVIGELIGGIILGPTVLGMVFPTAFDSIFPSQIGLSRELNCFIQFGMLMFMFMAGIEIDLKFVWEKRKQSFYTSALGIVLPLCLGIGIGFWFPLQQDSVDIKDQWVYCLFIGTALSISALPVILKMLLDLNLLKSEIGIVTMSSAAINDLIGWIILACLISVVQAEGSVIAVLAVTIMKIVIFIGLVAIIGLIAEKIVRRCEIKLTGLKKVFMGVTITFILVMAIIAEYMELHSFFTSFLLGIAFRQVLKDDAMNYYKSIYDLSASIFAPIYFVSIGLQVNFINSFDLTLVTVIVVIGCVTKVCGSGVGAMIGGMQFKPAMCVGFGLNARGAIGIVIASTALEFGIINDEFFVALVMLAIVTSVMGGAIIRKIIKYNDLELLGASTRKHRTVEKCIKSKLCLDNDRRQL